MSRLYLKDGKVVLKQVYLLLLLNPSILRQIMSVQEQSRYVVKSGYSSISFTRKFGFTAYPTSVPFGKTQTNTFTTQLVKGMTYEWSTPSGWKINNGGNTKEGLE